MVLIKELGHVHNQVTNHRQARQRAQLNGLFEAADISEAGQAVFAR